MDFLYKPLDSDAVKSKVNVFVDLFRQKQEVRQIVAQREATVRELNAVQQELQRALEMRDQFMSMVAHELRTPLNTLYLEAQMRKLQLERGNMAHFAPEQTGTHGGARHAPDPRHGAPDRRHARCIAHPRRQAVDPHCTGGPGSAAAAYCRRPVAPRRRHAKRTSPVDRAARGRLLGRIPRGAGDRQPDQQRPCATAAASRSMCGCMPTARMPASK